jgi:hypothetical protein
MTVRSCFMLALASAVVGLGVAGGPAWAQAPPNDTFEQATQITSVPFSQTLDTSEATTDSTDAEALAACGIPVTGAATVWYEYTPSADQSLVVSTSGSTNYTTGVAVLTGSPGSLSAVTCFAGIGTFSATASQTYHIVVADIGGGNGGTLNLSVEAQGVELSVDRFGRFDPKTGVATVTGTLTCPDGFSGTVSGSLSQRSTTARTFLNPNVPCNGAAKQWSVTFTPLNGKFEGGPADASVDAVVCLPRGCIADHADRSIILRTDAPSITSMTPSDGECGVSRTAPISVLFDKPMDKPSVEAAFSLKRTSNGDPVSGSFSWSGNLLRYTPSTPLGAAQVYTATVGTGARDLAGTHLAPKIWQFTTTPQPLIIFVYPVKGADGLPHDASVVVAFDTGMDKPSAQAAFSLKRTSNGVPVSGSFGWFGNALIFKPASDLTSGVSYTARETNGAKNLNGRRVESGRTWVFSVVH